MAFGLKLRVWCEEALAAPLLLRGLGQAGAGSLYRTALFSPGGPLTSRDGAHLELGLPSRRAA